jgi:predicted transcriptional regulator
MYIVILRNLSRKHKATIDEHNRSREEIYYDILCAIDVLQYSEPTYTRIKSSTIHNMRGRKSGSTQFLDIKGALLRNVGDKANLSSRQSKMYLMDLYTQGLVDLGAYMGNVDHDYKTMRDSPHEESYSLITVTDKGYQLLKLLRDIRELLSFNTKKTR